MIYVNKELIFLKTGTQSLISATNEVPVPLGHASPQARLMGVQIDSIASTAECEVIRWP